MFVAGAMAATWAAMVMKTPAEAARAPVGATYTTMGTAAPSWRWTIARIERSSPPGVSSWMTSAWLPSVSARSMAVPTRRRVIGVITPSMVNSETREGAGRASDGHARARATRAMASVRGLIGRAP
jgi:hypothetical protein